MSDIIDRIKKRIEKEQKFYEDLWNTEANKESQIDKAIHNARNFLYRTIFSIFNEELAKEPQEEPNIPLECVDGSCPIALSEEYEEWGMDVVHSYAECPYQPQVQPIVRSIDEIADAANMSCPPRYCEHDCGSPEYECKQCWIEWLTKKEV